MHLKFDSVFGKFYRAVIDAETTWIKRHRPSDWRRIIFSRLKSYLKIK